MLSLRTKISKLLVTNSVLPDISVSSRHLRTTPCLDRIIRPRFPDFSPKLTPDLKVQDTVVGDGEHPALAEDPDAPRFDMEDPYVEAPAKCVICENQINIDYKNVQLLSQFISQFTGTYVGGGGRSWAQIYPFVTFFS